MKFEKGKKKRKKNRKIDKMKQIGLKSRLI